MATAPPPPPPPRSITHVEESPRITIKTRKREWDKEVTAVIPDPLPLLKNKNGETFDYLLADLDPALAAINALMLAKENTPHVVSIVNSNLANLGVPMIHRAVVRMVSEWNPRAFDSRGLSSVTIARHRRCDVWVDQRMIPPPGYANHLARDYRVMQRLCQRHNMDSDNSAIFWCLLGELTRDDVEYPKILEALLHSEGPMAMCRQKTPCVIALYTIGLTIVAGGLPRHIPDTTGIAMLHSASALGHTFAMTTLAKMNIPTNYTTPILNVHVTIPYMMAAARSYDWDALYLGAEMNIMSHIRDKVISSTPSLPPASIMSTSYKQGVEMMAMAANLGESSAQIFMAELCWGGLAPKYDKMCGNRWANMAIEHLSATPFEGEEYVDQDTANRRCVQAIAVTRNVVPMIGSEQTLKCREHRWAIAIAHGLCIPHRGRPLTKESLSFYFKKPLAIGTIDAGAQVADEHNLTPWREVVDMVPLAELCTLADTLYHPSMDAFTLETETILVV